MEPHTDWRGLEPVREMGEATRSPSFWLFPAVLGIALGFAGCGDGGGSSEASDAGVVDATVVDATVVDATVVDATVVDATSR